MTPQQKLETAMGMYDLARELKAAWITAKSSGLDRGADSPGCPGGIYQCRAVRYWLSSLMVLNKSKLKYMVTGSNCQYYLWRAQNDSRC